MKHDMQEIIDKFIAADYRAVIELPNGLTILRFCMDIRNPVMERYILSLEERLDLEIAYYEMSNTEHLDWITLTKEDIEDIKLLSMLG